MLGLIPNSITTLTQQLEMPKEASMAQMRLPIDLFYCVNENYINKVSFLCSFCQDLYLFLKSKTVFKVALILERRHD